jgi:D-3-phosphoglycerate dehydrogenase
MARQHIKIGVTQDLFGKGGRPMFGDGPLALFEAAGLAWETVPPNPRGLNPEIIGAYDALFIGGSPVNEQALSGDTGRLRVVARNGVGFDAVDVDALTRRGIMLVNTPAAVRNGVATSAVGLILALTLRLPLKARLPKEGRWAERVDHPGVGLPGRTLGIVGLGGIGREIVRLMAPFEMRVLASDPHLDAAMAGAAGAELILLDRLLGQSDLVVIACYLDKSTYHLISRERLALMKPSAFLVNIARGPIIDEPALIEALAEGRIAGAGLDVFEQEPPDPSNPLLAMDNVIATAHSLCWTDQFLESVARSAISDIIAALTGDRPRHLVNPAALDKMGKHRAPRSAKPRGALRS